MQQVTKSAFKPIENRSLHVQVFNAIKDRIVSGKLACGERLPSEAQLCEEFQVSRNILREAIKSLQSIGLLEVSPGKRGTTVSMPDVRLAQELIFTHLKMQGVSLRELFEARLAVEAAAARQAAERRTDEDLAALRDCVEDMERCRSLDRATDLDFKFHDLMVETTKNAVFKVYNMPLLDLQRSIRRETIERKGMERSAQYHRELLDAIASADADRAAHTMRNHIRHAMEVLQVD